VKRFNMEKTALKDLLYGGLTELMNNKEFYYRSSVGANYSHWTEKGTVVMIEYVASMAQQIQTAEDIFLDKRAKELVINGLTGK